MLSQSSFCNQCLLNLSCLVDWIFLMKDFCLFIQVCSSVWSSEGLISISGILEFLAAKAANSPPHVLHQEPGPLRRWNAHTTREAHPAGLELLWILHGPGTWKEAPECRPDLSLNSVLEGYRNQVLISSFVLCVCRAGGAGLCFWNAAAVWGRLGPVWWAGCSFYPVCP